VVAAPRPPAKTDHTSPVLVRCSMFRCLSGTICCSPLSTGNSISLLKFVAPPTHFPCAFVVWDCEFLNISSGGNYWPTTSAISTLVVSLKRKGGTADAQVKPRKLVPFKPPESGLWMYPAQSVLLSRFCPVKGLPYILAWEPTDACASQVGCKLSIY
jgi:hypothetical protein